MNSIEIKTLISIAKQIINYKECLIINNYFWISKILK